MDNLLNIREFVCASNQEFTAVSYFAKRSASKNIYVHFFTNLEDAGNTEVIERRIRNTGHTEKLKAPKAVVFYGKHHVYVDAKKNSQSRCYHPFRSFRAWRAEINIIFYMHALFGIDRL
jgi:hypothetical protein